LLLFEETVKKASADLEFGMRKRGKSLLKNLSLDMNFIMEIKETFATQHSLNIQE